MGRRLAHAVVLRNPDGVVEVLLPGVEAPDWAVEQITNEAVYAPEDADEAPSGDAPDDDADPADTEGDDAEVPDDSWTVAQLTEYAAEHDIDLDGATKKADILAAIQA